MRVARVSLEARFVTDLVIRAIPPAERRRHRLPDTRQLWEVMQPLVYQSAVARCRFLVPAGLVTDLSSVPRLPLAYLFTGDVAHAEAVIHDWLYQAHLVASRALADEVLYEAMVAMEKPAWRRWLIYQGVRLGGASAWESGPSRLTILNRQNDIPALVAAGPASWQTAGLLLNLGDTTAFA